MAMEKGAVKSIAPLCRLLPVAWRLKRA